MSLRPLTTSENLYAKGTNLSSFMAFLGATTGMITHLNSIKQPVSGHWFPNM